MHNSNNTGNDDRDDSPPSRTSVDSDDSAAQRMRWRNHESQYTPLPELRNPFEDTFSNYNHQKSNGARPLLPSSPQQDQRMNKHSTAGSLRPGHHDETESANETEEGDAAGGGMGEDDDERKREIDAEAGGENKGEDADAQSKVDQKARIGFRGRIRHFTWTWFTMTMATGGIANVLYTVPYRFKGLYAIGCIFFLLNICLFLFNVTMISLRFHFYPRTFRASFVHPTESLFIPAAIISFGTILINVSQYGVEYTGPWLRHVMVVLYWVDLALAVGFSVGIYLIIWSTHTFTISQMTPIWIFPAYPLLILGPHAANLAPKLAPDMPTTALTILLAGFIAQGIGFLVSLMIYSAFLYRLMTQKLPRESLRPGMFISVGPSGFTIAAVIGMGSVLPKVVGPDFMGEGNGELAGRVGQICANWMGLWLWGLAIWFFLVSVGAHWSCAVDGKLDFAMTWYSFVFPNTALTTATFAVGKMLGKNEDGGVRAIGILGCAMTVALVMTWCFVFGMMLRAVWMKQILWPQKQEDRDEGGWKAPKEDEEGARKTNEDGGEGGGLGLLRTLSRRGIRRGNSLRSRRTRQTV